MAVFLWRELSAQHRNWALLALMILGAAVAIDFVEGLFLQSLNSYFLSHVQRLLEEMLEMLGTTILLVVFLKVLLSKLDFYVSIKN